MLNSNTISIFLLANNVGCSDREGLLRLIKSSIVTIVITTFVNVAVKK